MSDPLPLPPGAVPLPIGAIPLDDTLDRKTGAPAAVRAAVGAAPTSDDRLATLRGFYPDAQPFEGDNFVFTDRGRPTLYNEDNPRVLGVPIPTVGDVASVAPEIGEMAGGAVGGAVATAAGAASGGLGMAAIPAGVGLGAAAGRELVQRLGGVTRGTVDSRGLGQHLADTAVTAGVNAAAGRIPELVGAGVRKVFGGVTDQAERLAAGRVMDFAGAGVPAPASGAITGSKAMQIVENGLSNTPGGASVMQKRAGAAVDGAKAASDEIARRLATGDGAHPTGAVESIEGAGNVLVDGAKAAGGRFADRVRKLGEKLYEEAGAVRVPGDAVADLAKNYRDRVAADPGLESTFRSLTNELGAVVGGAKNTGGISFAALHRLRMKVGEALDNPDVSNYRGVAQKDLEAYYAALTTDMEAAATAAGPGAEKALAVHDRYIRYQRNKNLPPLDRVARAITPESALNLALSGTGNGGTRLTEIRRNLKPGEWDAVAGAVWDRLGRARPGAADASAMGEGVGDFSVGTFLTNWSRLSPGAQRALFGGSRYAGVVGDMNRLVRVTAALKDADRMANPSGTARNLMIGMGVGAVGHEAIVNGDPKGAALMAATGVLAPRAAATLLTHPKFIRWLAGAAAPTGPMTGRGVRSWAGDIARLGAIAEAEPGLRDAIHQYAAALRAPAPPPAR